MARVQATEHEVVLHSITLDPDSMTCPECGHIIVPCDDRGPEMVDVHVCDGPEERER